MMVVVVVIIIIMMMMMVVVIVVMMVMIMMVVVIILGHDRGLFFRHASATTLVLGSQDLLGIWNGIQQLGE
jgi:hypothetical protein